jgi:hypothetical protein
MSTMQHSSVTLAPSQGQACLTDLLATPGSWSREARTVLSMASERGICLDDERLIYSDVHDLVTLERELRQIATADVRRHLPRELRDYICA